ncbi:hypothetical protein [Sphingosinicella rhizophila]|uniref:WYL domain-containing protein n=1 Tax=Sphingosinicella rhizophila TaxID=3050082 RepID=A0ABU3QA49_9SPHN|nr:hypothetical protein [Sphingosinicella sp. GR2756]MDT9600281.1 hypothetical protein [Sphingosinicella sp. GR2756]
MALEKGCCLELYYDGWSRVVEVYAVGLDSEGREVIQAWQPQADINGPGRPGWKLLYLDETRKVAVSGYFAEAPRPDYVRDPAIVKVLREIAPLETSPQE